MSERDEAFELVVHPGRSCDASLEIQTIGKVGGTAAADVEICCDHCGLLQSFVRQGDDDTVTRGVEEGVARILVDGCKKLAEKEIDPANVPQRFFPTVNAK